ncbi:MAG: LysR family transcriptional regulator [Clostridia bacterium]|nr:LysR family transcriptional regulator [Clostridia bacterium]
MDIKNLNTLIQVAELGSFSRAGERLGYSQPTISVQIKQLEEELGVRLFDRIGHAIRLTGPGKEILGYAKEICRICGQMTLNSTGEDDRPTIIRLATADSLCGPLTGRVLPILRKQCPNISLKWMTAGTVDMFRMLDHNEADLVCTLDRHIYNTNYVVAREEKIGVHFVAAADHPLAKREVLTKRGLLGQDFLLTEKDMSYRGLLDEWMAEDSLEIKPVLESGSADLICKLVEQGHGISFLPDYVTESACRRGTIVRLDAEGFQPELWNQLLYHREKWVTRPMERVIEYLKIVSLS